MDTPPDNTKKPKQIQFKPPLLAVFLTIFGISLFIGLGKWQLERAAEKTELLEQFQQQQSQSIIALPDGNIKNLEQWRHKKVSFIGTPLADRQFLLDNQIRDGKVGFNVITPFQRPDGSHILVDRGWLPLTGTRADLPDAAIAPQQMKIEGTIYVPLGKPFSLGVMDEGSLDWPRLITHVDYVEIRKRLNVYLPALTIRMSPELVDGYQREWPLFASSKNRNLGYAVQWFALALTVLIIFLVLNLKIRRE